MNLKITRWLLMCFAFAPILAFAQPANDLCSGATPVTLGTGTCGPTVMADNTAATGVAGDVCNSTSTSYGDGDIWFSFVAGGTTAYLDLISEPGGGTAASMYMSVYDACAGTCVYNNNFVATTAIEVIPSLTPGETYFIRMYESGNNVFGAFEFCMFNPGAAPANDDCAAATPVSLGTGSCGPTVMADNSFATGVAGNVCNSTSTSYGDGDIWFSFEAGGTSAYLDLISEPGGGTAASMYISVYDACAGSCVYNNNSISTTTVEEITGLTAGSTYYIRMYDFGANDFGAFEFCMFNAGGPPANDLCSGATPVTVGNLTCGPTVTSTNAFATGIAGDVCNSTSTSYGDGDIWFSFEAGGTTAVLDLITTTGSLYISVYDACGGACVYNNNFISTSTDEVISGLTPGATYFIRMYESGNNSFGTIEFCMFTPPPPPANDLCAGAIPAIVGANGTCPGGTGAYSEDFSQVTQSGVFPTCDASGNYDLWYTWVATAASIEFTDGLGDPGLAVFSGSCGAFTELGCLNNLSGTIGGLVVGNTYYLNIWDDSPGVGTVEWCWQAGPACADPSGLQVGNIAETTADVSFNALAAGGHTVEYGATGFTQGTGTTVAVPTGGSVTLTGLTGVTSYDVYVTANCGGTSAGPVGFTTLGPPPANDLCGNATVVTLGTGTCGPTVMADNTNASGVAGDVCNSTSTSYGAGDIWFSFTAAGSSAYLDLLSEPGGGTAATMYISVYDACGGSCVYNNNFIAVGTTEEITGLTAGNTYLIRMYESGNNVFGAFEFCMFNPGAAPANDDCGRATAVTLGTGTCGPTVMADNSFATGVAGDVCNSTSTTYGAGDIWFSFTAAGSSAYLDLLSEPGGGTAASMYISVYDDCGGACVYNNNFIAVGTTEEITGLTAGSTYLIRMYESGNNVFGAFEFCMFNPGAAPANDDCVGATPVTLGVGTCGPTVIADNSFATGVAGDVCGNTSTTYGDGDIWFSFVASGPDAYLNLLSEPGGGTAASMYISVYDACGGSCVYNNNFVSVGTAEQITGLTSGSTYYIRMYESGNNVFGTFELCMFGAGPPPANDECAAATPVTLGVGNCGPTVTATNAFATGTAGNVCGSTSTSYGDGDIWFSFEAGTETVFLDMATTVGSMYMSMYDACGGACVYDNNLLSTSSPETIPGLTVGNTYYIRMYESLNDAIGSFDFCMYNNPPPPANDECADAVGVVVNLNGATCTPATGYNNGATNSTATFGGADPTCSSATYSGGDIWYSFTAPASIVELDVLSNAFSTFVAVVYEAGCTNTGIVTCATRASTGTVDLTGLTAGTDYVLRVYDWGNNDFGPVEFCLNASVPTVATGGGCVGTFTATVDGTGGVVDFLTGSGDIVASIGNTQNLGSVAVSLYIGTGPRQTGAGDYYLDRNLAIVPTTQPTTAVDVTVYVLNSEVTAMINASGDVATVNDLQFGKVSGTATCSPTFPGGAVPVGIAATPYGTDWAFTASVSSFSEFFALPSAAPLPVELSSFNAYATTSGNRVEWTAATELDLYMYTVERAIDPASFSAFADVAPTGTEYAEAVYTSEDLNPATTTYYRLRMEDLDGTVEYSDVVAVTRDDVKGGISMFPNPAHDQVTFEILPGAADSDKINVVVTDLSGRVIREWSLATGQRTDINISDIPSGVYMVSAVSATAFESQRLVID